LEIIRNVIRDIEPEYWAAAIEPLEYVIRVDDLMVRVLRAGISTRSPLSCAK
jgi:hypothetical protein